MKKHTMLSEIWRRFKKNKQAIVGLIVLIIFILVAIFAKQIAPYWYDDQDASRAMIGPCAQYPFGTDNLGRDVLSRLIYGSRIPCPSASLPLVFPCSPAASSA